MVYFVVPRRMKGRVSARLTVSDKKVDFPLLVDEDSEVGSLQEEANDEKQFLVRSRRDLFFCLV